MTGKDSRVLLSYDSVSLLVGNEKLGVITLTDKTKDRALSIICGIGIANELKLRDELPDGAFGKRLPEVLVKTLGYLDDLTSYYIYISGIRNGEYISSLMNEEQDLCLPLRVSEAVLLARIMHIDMFIDAGLMMRQSSAYEQGAQKMTIPLNALKTEELVDELEKAISKEDYRQASYIKEELDRRKHDAGNE
ncbi:DUF151 domain-containing protein [Xylanibacter muris]|uniref:BFN domain-containing protein n=1 Tax=Xylanibacter muris TaxID=2736290 RepID=A0ABX2AN73_9BACT|nr:DUF151 domain-containing protein [Xylanibacter muris]NPD92205.1 hypothetical protein [Xylanibacter muris]